MPDGWVNPPPNKNKGGTNLSDVDKPGIWSSFYFKPTFCSSRHKIQYISTEYVTVPNNENDEHVVGGWNFHYDERKKEKEDGIVNDPGVHRGNTDENKLLFP